MWKRCIICDYLTQLSTLVSLLCSYYISNLDYVYVVTPESQKNSDFPNGSQRMKYKLQHVFSQKSFHLSLKVSFLVSLPVQNGFT